MAIHYSLIIVVLVSYAIVAGSAFLFTSYTSNDIPPITLCALRLLVGCIGLSTCTLIFDRSSILKLLRDKRFLLVGLTMGIFNNFLPYSLYPYAFYLGVDVGIASIFSGSTPLFALFFGTILLPIDKMNGRLCQSLNIFGICTGITGIIIISIGEITSPDFEPQVILGYLILLVYACSKAFASVFGSIYIINYNIITIAAAQTFFGFIFAAISSLAFDFWIPPDGYPDHYQFFFDTTWQVWVGIFYLGLGPSMLCYIFQFFLLKRVGSLKQITVDFLTPIVGIVEGALFAGDWDNVGGIFIASEIIGCLVLFAGVASIHAGASLRVPPRDSKSDSAEEDPILNVDQSLLLN